MNAGGALGHEKSLTDGYCQVGEDVGPLFGVAVRFGYGIACTDDDKVHNGAHSQHGRQAGVGTGQPFPDDICYDIWIDINWV